MMLGLMFFSWGLPRVVFLGVEVPAVGRGGRPAVVFRKIEAPQGQEVEVKLWGVHSLPKEGTAFSQGDVAYWDGSKVVASGDTLLD